MNLAEHVAERLGRSKSSNGWYQCQCPCHDDGKASLHIKNNDRNEYDVVVDCKAGCHWKAIKDELRLRGLIQDWRDPTVRASRDPHFDQKKPSYHTFHMNNIYYEYTDPKGNVLYKVVRVNKKDGKYFMQITKAENSNKWLNKGPKRHELVLYHLPEVIHAIRHRKIIFLVEGEKDVESLRERGFNATCNPMGAGKWFSHYNYMLIGAQIIVLPDNDEPGRKHSTLLHRSLTGICKYIIEVNLPDLPKKGDVSDWFEKGFTEDDLKEVVKTAIKTRS